MNFRLVFWLLKVIPLLLLIPSSGAIPGVAPGTSFFANHSFETGDFTGWTLACSDAGTDTIETGAPVPDGANKLRVVMDTDVVLGGCSHVQDEVNPSVAFEDAMQDFRFYSHVTFIGVGDCVASDCRMQVTIDAFNDEGLFVEWTVDLFDSAGGSVCTPTAWDGVAASYCDTVPIECLNLVNADFCLYEELDLHDNVNALCLADPGASACLSNIEAGTNPTIEIGINFSTNANDNTFTYEVDDVFSGCAVECESGPPPAPDETTTSENFTTAAQQASTFLAVILVILMATMVVGAFTGKLTPELAKVGLVAVVVVVILLSLTLGLGAVVGD